MRKPRVMVTGGAGFLGSHLCDRLLKDGNDVICVDNLFTGSKDNIRHLLGNPYFEFIRHDVIQPFLSNATRFIILHVLPVRYGIKRIRFSLSRHLFTEP